MIIQREMLKEARSAMANFPILLITGARQTGKTTLSRMICDKPYYNLESPDTRELIKADPRMFLNKIAETGAIIDEFQRIPELASYLQELVDTNKEKGFLVLTGSNNFLLMENVSQSLAGRVALLNLPSLTLNEIKCCNLKLSTDELLYRGFYPVIYAENSPPTKTYSYYYQTYVERDVRQLINIKDLHLFQRFMRLCAGRVGQLVNYDQLANETGTSAKTIKSWISVLEASYLIFLLPPYHSNTNKRIVKSHKLYFYDVGIVSFLLRIESESHIQNHPLRGAIFENMVISEYIKSRLNKGLAPNIFFYRDNHQREVDLVIATGGSITLIEIKSGLTYHTSFSESLNWLEKTLTDVQLQKLVLYDGEQEWDNGNFAVMNFRKYFSEEN